MSGVSSEGVVPILGLSGSVAMPALLSWAVGAGLISLFWQVYFTTRISTLMAVILALVGNDVTARYNCAVRTFRMSHMLPRPDRP